jgi:ribosomal silencing factor RsfS
MASLAGACRGDCGVCERTWSIMSSTSIVSHVVEEERREGVFAMDRTA